MPDRVKPRRLPGPNDALAFAGVAAILFGAYLISDALALLALGGMLLGAALVRVRNEPTRPVS